MTSTATTIKAPKASATVASTVVVKDTTPNAPELSNYVSSDDDFIEDLISCIRPGQPIILVRTDDTHRTTDLIHKHIKTISERVDGVYLCTPVSGWMDITPNDATATIASITLDHAEAQRGSDVDAKKKYIPSWIDPPVPGAPREAPVRQILRHKKKFAKPGSSQANRKSIFMLSLMADAVKKDSMGFLQALRDYDAAVREELSASNLILIAHRTYELHDDFYNLLTEVEHRASNKDDIRKIYFKDFYSDYVCRRKSEPVLDKDGNKVMSPDGQEKKKIGGVLTKDLFQCDFDAMCQGLLDMGDYAVNTLQGMPERLILNELKRALTKCYTRQDKYIIAYDLDVFKRHIYQAKFEAMNTLGTLELMDTSKYSEVGGFHPLKAWLQEQAWAMTKDARDLNVDRPKGAGLIGPPGTGKTLIAQTAGATFNMPVVKFNVDAVFNKFVGESEQRLTQTLRAIESMAPCVLFIDEVDKVFNGASGGNDSGVTSRVFGKLLSWMQDSNADVFSIITANRVQNIPSEFLRKGRLDELWCVSYPNLSERKEILTIHMNKRKRSLTSLDKIAGITENYSAAELEYIVKSANTTSSYHKRAMTEDDLVQCAMNITPQSKSFAQDIALMLNWAKANARFASDHPVESWDKQLTEASETVEA